MRVPAALVAAMLVASCGLLPAPPSSAYDIDVSNGTTIPIAVRVNGAVVRVFAPGEAGTLAAANLGPLPWAVVASTPSGRQLASPTIAAGSVGCTENPEGDGRSCWGVVELVDLSCGRFVLEATSLAVSFPAPGPGVPGDCEP